MIALFVVATLTDLDVLDLHWAFGGAGLMAAGAGSFQVEIRGRSSSGRTRQAPAFTPSRRDTLLVATALIAAAGLVVLRAGLFAEAVSHWTVQAAVVGIALVFLARARGDFKLVGFFKLNNDTAFAYWDTRLYSPPEHLAGCVDRIRRLSLNKLTNRKQRLNARLAERKGVVVNA